MYQGARKGNFVEREEMDESNGWILGYFDGGCILGDKISYGCIFCRRSETIYTECGIEFVKNLENAGLQATNTTAEYCGCYAALKWIEVNIRDNRVILFGDSTLVLKQLTGKWQWKDKPYVRIMKECKTLIHRLPNVQLQFIKSERNKAHELCELAMKEEKVRSKEDIKKWAKLQKRGNPMKERTLRERLGLN